jgi:nucleoid DNA-binding protein
MGAKPMSKTKVVAHITEKVGTRKKTAAQFFEELHKLAVKEAKSSPGTFTIPGLGRVTVHRKLRMGGSKKSRSDEALSTLAKIYGF